MNSLRFMAAPRGSSLEGWTQVAMPGYLENSLRTAMQRLPLLHFLVLRPRLLQNGNVRIRILPHGEEVLIGHPAAGFVTLERVGARQAEMRNRNQHIDSVRAAHI